MRAVLAMIASSLVFGLAPAWGAEIYSGATAEAIYAALQSGQGWCQVTQQVINPTTQVVEQTLCRCVSSVDGRTNDASGRTTALVVSFGPEGQCAPPRATAAQIAQANANIATIDAQLAGWNNFLQHLWDYRDQYAYANDPNYKAQYDAWVQSWADYGGWVVQQLQAQRQSNVSVVASGAAPPSPPAGGGAGTGPFVNPSAVPSTAPAPSAGTAQPAAGPGLLGVPMDTPQQ
jgi:hypothetical protein